MRPARAAERPGPRTQHPSHACPFLPVKERKTYARVQACVKVAFINEDHRTFRPVRRRLLDCAMLAVLPLRCTRGGDPFLLAWLLACALAFAAGPVSMLAACLVSPRVWAAIEARCRCVR